MGRVVEFRRRRVVAGRGPQPWPAWARGRRKWTPYWRRKLYGQVVVLALVTVLGTAAGLMHALDGGGLGIIEAFGTATASRPAAPATPLRFARCHSALQRECVIDGDTLRVGGDTIRVADIDAPEVIDFKCADENARGERATARLLTLVNAGPFELAAVDRDEDVYGRKLRVLTRDGQSLGRMLVAEGLARTWDGARRGWC